MVFQIKSILEQAEVFEKSGMLDKHIRIADMRTHNPVEHRRRPFGGSILVSIHMRVGGPEFSRQHFFA
ncbi:hypothetical protein D3C73_668070 [compost metagenome]